MPLPESASLPGGNSGSPVVRNGEVTLKPATSATDAIHAYLTELGRAGVDVPVPHGRDEDGRQRLEFVDGTLAIDAGRLDESGLRRVGALIRSIHDASEHIEIPSGVPWTSAIPAPRSDLMCHNDLAPWNLIIGERWVFIDWDAAAPSTRAWDLAYAAQSFTLNDPSLPPVEAAHDLSNFVDGYRADATLRSTLPDVMIKRVDAMVALLENGRVSGTEPWASMHDDGHGDHWRAVSAYVADNVDMWRRALIEGEAKHSSQAT